MCVCAPVTTNLRVTQNSKSYFTLKLPCFTHTHTHTRGIVLYDILIITQIVSSHLAEGILFGFLQSTSRIEEYRYQSVQ